MGLVVVLGTLDHQSGGNDDDAGRQSAWSACLYNDDPVGGLVALLKYDYSSSLLDARVSWNYLGFCDSLKHCTALYKI